MKDKLYYKRALQMAWPSVLESFFLAMAALIDTMMVATLGSYAIASVGLTNQPKFIAYAIFFAINTAVSALIARRKGQNDRKGANRVFITAISISIILCILITIVTIYFSNDLMIFAGSNSDTHIPAKTYFDIIIAGMFFNIIAMCINAAQRGTGNTKIAFSTNLTSSIINVIFNFLLINGNFGFPKLGIKGAAYATVLGSLVACFMSISSIFKIISFVNVKYIIKHKIKPKIDAAKSIFNLSISLFIENIFMRIGFLATAITAAKLGTAPFAAHNAAMGLLSVSFSFGDGMQVAAVALSGNALGKEDKNLAFKFGHICQRIGFAISIILSIILFIFSREIMMNFFKEENIIQMGIMTIRFIMIILILQISQIIYGGCLRAGGDVKYTLITSIISVTIIRTGATILFTSVLGLGLIGIWIGITFDQLSRYILLRHRFKQGKWVDIKI